MAKEQVTRSDVTQNLIPDEKVVNVVIKGHPKLDEAKQIDSSAEELAALKFATGLVEIEFRPTNGQSYTRFITATELEKVVPLEVLQKADGIRGRRPGVSPKLNGSR
ncbi:hypothetical protein [Mycolicibacterium porcinum]|uniref:hypothetical protein n=1 Tax=Mycolicibacterium porcinum TaxID=39693 RepID=UPI000849295E|nr:hypothetical protein [Mycolicibacterium porcinum]ODR25789.1 hypothetical protein BHQ19_10175 [Mycolicibacterium porcinum]